MDSILVNLKILSMIQINQKVSISKGYLQIDYSPLQCLKRWWNHDSRDSLLTFLNDLIKKIQSIIDKNQDSTFLILNEMDNCLKGINNLKVTYYDDPITIVRLDNMFITIKNMSIIHRAKLIS